MTHHPVVLCILDGFGHRDNKADNAIKLAHMPTFDRLWATMPHAWLQTSGLAVGLPEGQMGNSEVGHMNIGSGRVILQDLPRINAAIAGGSLGRNPALVDLIQKTSAAKGRVQLMGLLSPGGVHSHVDHILALCQIITAAGLRVAIHAFLDGRDTPPNSAMDYVSAFEAALPEGAEICSVSGRYWAMDRDNRFDRVEKAYNALHGDAPNGATALEVIRAAYDADVTDEFIEPHTIGAYAGMEPGDSLLMANFRADRAREILSALVDPDFSGFDRAHRPSFSAAAGMVNYSTALDAWLTCLFPAQTISDSFGELVAKAGLRQLRIAETEKYAHVTFFFNGGSEAVFENEDRILIPSPDVPTYDLKPEMSAPEVTDKLVEAVRSGRYGAIVVNYANPDMVGHTGQLDAAVKAVEAVDAALERLCAAVKEAGATMLITADHGNVELMRDPETGAPHTAHTHFDVPILMTGLRAGEFTLQDGALSDVAPTLLALMDVAQPAAMTGKSLLVPAPDLECAAVRER